MVFLALIVGTFVSEDLASVTAGLLVRDGRIGFVAAVASCAFGILLGDLGLWAIGRLSSGAARSWPPVARRLDRLPLSEMRDWLDRHTAAAMIGSRFLPGSRLPLYVCAGLIGLPLTRFGAWAAIAVLLWTPILVLLAAASADAALGLAGFDGWLPRVVVVIAMLLVLQTARPFANSASRARIIARLTRWSRWEFWPMWLFYAPVAAWIALLAIRYRGLTTITAANPGIPDGGTVGESKSRILAMLPPEFTIPSALLPMGTPADRLTHVTALMQEHGWRFPLVFKPDVGQRGVGVRLVNSLEDVETYCSAEARAILVQPYHPGPFEAGIFYYRFPGSAKGRIFSITDKEFPFVVGDGRSTVETLIQSHPRYRLQANTFLPRHRDVLGRVLDIGERLQLAIAGNHAQGTLFRDGAHLWTGALERRIDQIAQSYPGFFVGRFDVRYADADAFKEGSDLAIVELNGATAESTDIYDPERTLVGAYAQLFKQWAIVFAIGAANRAAGAAITPTRRLIALVRTHLASKPAFELSD